MPSFITGSLCLTTLIEQARAGHSAFSKSPKNGKIYFNFAQWVNEEANEFGQHTSLSLNSKKEMAESEGKVYFGNGKIHQAQPINSKDLAGAEDLNVPVRESQSTWSPGGDDDLPF